MAAGGFFLMDYLVSGEEVEVPNLLMKTKEQAIVTLAEQGLMLKTPIEEFPDADTPSGLVIEQRPYPNTRVKKGRRVSITVSTGAEQLSVPDLLERQEQEIHSILRTSGLSLGRRATVYSSLYPKDTVIAQDPLPGLRMVEGNRVDVLVSLGPPQLEFIMPDLTGETLSVAVDQLNQTPLKISDSNIVNRETMDRSLWNTVIEQVPKAGDKVAVGDQLKLVVGTGGYQISQMRMVHVMFPVPVYLSFHPLSLIVWDDSTSLLGHPLVKPLVIDPFQNEIEMWIPVFGDAYVMLGIMDDYGPYPLPEIYNFRYYPSLD